MSIPSQTHLVLGTEVTMPVHIRDARCFLAGFTADADAVTRAMESDSDSAGTVPTPLRLGRSRTMCVLVFVEYIDGDLGPYHEFGVCFFVEGPDQPRMSRTTALRRILAGDARVHVHRLPVDGEFTLAAGRGIWGFPKTMADFDVENTGATKHGRVSAEGELIADLTVRPGIPVPGMRLDASFNAYCQLDGILRLTPWHLNDTETTRGRLGGARLVLGSHPMAEELRSLKLGRHALMTSSVGHLQMQFDDAVVVAQRD